MDHLEAVIDQLMHGAEEDLTPATVRSYRSHLRRALLDPDSAPDWVLFGIELRISAN